MNTEEKMKKMMKVVEEQMPDEGRLCIHMLLNEGHHDEWSAKYKISKMYPVAWLGVDTTPTCMEEYLSLLGITPSRAKEMVYRAYEKARAKGNEIGITAPKLDANEWDCYWCLAMCISDYWITHWADLDVAAMIAYQYLSDPDR